MTRYIVKMIWVSLFTSLIAANVGVTIITETHITTTKIAVSAQLHTRPLNLASSESKILAVDAISVDAHTPETGADKRKISINTTTISIRPSNGPFSNGSTADLGPGIVELTASTTVLNQTMLSKGNTTGSIQQSRTRDSAGSTSETTVSSSGSEELNSSGPSFALNTSGGHGVAGTFEFHGACIHYGHESQFLQFHAGFQYYNVQWSSKVHQFCLTTQEHIQCNKFRPSDRSIYHGAKLFSIDHVHHQDGKHDYIGDRSYRSIKRYIEFFRGRTVQLTTHLFKLPTHH
jgi:hypothetical protein